MEIMMVVMSLLLLFNSCRAANPAPDSERGIAFSRRNEFLIASISFSTLFFQFHECRVSLAIVLLFFFHEVWRICDLVATQKPAMLPMAAVAVLADFRIVEVGVNPLMNNDIASAHWTFFRLIEVSSIKNPPFRSCPLSHPIAPQYPHRSA